MYVPFRTRDRELNENNKDSEPSYSTYACPFTAPIFSFKHAPTTSTSFHFGFGRSAAGVAWFASAAFLAWMWYNVLRKCRVIMSGVWTPSTSPGGALDAGWKSVDVMLSILEVMSSTRLLTNLGVTCGVSVDGQQEESRDVPRQRPAPCNTGIDPMRRCTSVR